MLTLGTVPAAKVAVNSGVASWAILWATAISDVGVAGGTLPHSSFILVPCSDSIGNGVIRFDDSTFTNGDLKVILDGSIGATM